MNLINYIAPKTFKAVAKNPNFEQLKFLIPRELKAKFVSKAKKKSKSQASVIKSLIHNYVNSDNS